MWQASSLFWELDIPASYANGSCLYFTYHGPGYSETFGYTLTFYGGTHNLQIFVNTGCPSIPGPVANAWGFVGTGPASCGNFYGATYDAYALKNPYAQQ